MPVTEFCRPVVYGKRGMICSNSPLAAAAGLVVLQQGGNAFDAALTVAAVEAVTLVPLCGLGGDSFILTHEGTSGKVTGINSSGVAATGATSDYYWSRGYKTMPLDGPHAVAVPGEVAAWEEMHQRFCTMPFAELLEPAIGYAQEGFPLSPGISRELAASTAKLAQFPASASLLLPNGRPLSAGDTLINTDLASSLRLVAQGEPRSFTGETWPGGWFKDYGPGVDFLKTPTSQATGPMFTNPSPPPTGGTRSTRPGLLPRDSYYWKC